MNVKAISGSPDTNYVKSQLEKIEFNIGQTAESVNIAVVAKDAIGDVGTPYDVEVSADGVTYAEIATPTELDEYFTITAANVSITVV